LVPARVPFLLAIEKPAELAALIRSSPRLAGLADQRVLAELALSDAGATARALKQRLNDLSRAPFLGADPLSLLDGPLVIAARQGRGNPDVLLVKRLSPKARASWQLASMLQAVSASLREVRVERYRGLPLRKVLVDARRRLTYVVLRDLLIAGTSDTWVKESLDLALGDAAPSAASQDSVKTAFLEERDALSFALVDAEVLRSEPGRPGPFTLALAQARWLRLAASPKGLLQLTLDRPPLPSIQSPARRPKLLVEGFAPRGTVVAVSRSFDLPAIFGSLFPETAAANPRRGDLESLRLELERALVSGLGQEAFWISKGRETQGGRAVASHVVGLELRDSQKVAASLGPLLPKLLAPPISSERSGAHELFCGGDGEALCLAVAGNALLVGNSREALEGCIEVFDGKAPTPQLLPASPQGLELLYLDAVGLSAYIAKSTELLGGSGADPREIGMRIEPIVASMRRLGTLRVELRPAGPDRLSGEVTTL
jgi:hypothetical protein